MLQIMKKTNTFNNKNFCFLNKAMFILIFMAFCSGNLYSQNGQFVLEANGGIPVTIGSDPSNMYAAPFLANRKDSRAQFLFEASELAAASSSGYTTISSLAFHVSGFSNGSLSSYEMRNITISMGHTIATYDGDGGTNVWGITMPAPGRCTWDGSATPEPLLTPLTVVKNSFNLTISQTGWVELQLDPLTPFVWNGVDSIVVEICKADPKTGPSPAFSLGRYQFTGMFHSQPTGSDTHTLTRSLYNINNNITTSPGCCGGKNS